jgi:hypothetical protein
MINYPQKYNLVLLVSTLLLFSCNSNTNKKVIILKTSEFNTPFELKESGQILPIFNLHYYYEKESEKELVYQLDKESNGLKLDKFILDDDKEFRINTTFDLGIELNPDARYYTSHILGLDSFLLVERSLNKTIIYGFYQDRLFNTDTVYGDNKSYPKDFVFEITPYYDDFQSFTFSLKYLSVFPQRNITAESACFVERNKYQEAIWRLQKNTNKLVPEFAKHFTIYRKEKILRLRPNDNEIGVYDIKSSAIDSKKLNNDIGLGNIDYNLPVSQIVSESDYWVDFKYNAIDSQYLLVKKIGFQSKDGIRISQKDKKEQITYEYILLDDNLNFIKKYGVRTLATQNTPKFSRKNGFVTLDFDKRVVINGKEKILMKFKKLQL